MTKCAAADRNRKMATPHAMLRFAMVVTSGAATPGGPGDEGPHHGKGEVVGECEDQPTLYGVEKTHGNVVETKPAGSGRGACRCVGCGHSQYSNLVADPDDSLSLLERFSCSGQDRAGWGHCGVEGGLEGLGHDGWVVPVGGQRGRLPVEHLQDHALIVD